MKENITCAYCDGVALLKKDKKEIKYRKDVFTILAHFYQCESCKEGFTNSETDTISLLQVHNQYREKNQAKTRQSWQNNSYPDCQ
ncbi:MAG: hypothetical protein FYV88_4450 [Bacteroidetes bacterium]|nr:hypothetical protein [Bacteroidota bacterium]